MAFGQTALTTAQIAKKVSPSVVVIQGKTESGDFLGSGFIISKDGRIVTNLHVIRDMKTASVQLANGEVFDSVSVLAIDERRDLAVVQIAGFNLPILELGNSDLLTIGEPTVIVGSPRGLEGTVTAGILSSVRDSGDGYKVLQTDAAVNPGNSGGPLLNNKGQAIGVVSFKLKSSEGLNFAIPINYVRGLLNNLHEPTTLTQTQKDLDTGTRPGPNADASLEATIDLLRQLVTLSGVQFVSYNTSLSTNESVTIRDAVTTTESCTLVVKIVLQITPDALYAYKSLQENSYTVPLGALTIIDVKYLPTWEHVIKGDDSSYHVGLSSTSKTITLVDWVTNTYIVTPQLHTSAVDSLTLMFRDKVTAQRVAEAFKHGADLCRK